MFKKRKIVVCLSLVTLSGLGACGQSSQSVQEPKIKKHAGVVNIYNFGEYLPESFKPGFERLTSLKVNYDTFDTNEALNAKLVAGRSGYDVVVATNDWAAEQIAQGRFQKLDKSKINNLKNLDPALMHMLESVDPGNEYLVPWSWGYTGVGINEDMVKKALGSMPIPQNPFDLVFNPEYAKKLKHCGIMMSDSPTNLIPLALQYIGKSTSSDYVADYKEALAMLNKVRPYVAKFGASEEVNGIAGGNYCAFVTTAGDINMASQRANNPSIKPLLGNGGILFIDSMAIPADSKNVENAHAWIDYSLQPKVSAELTNEMGYPTPVTAAVEFVKPAIAKNKTIFLDERAIKSMVLSPIPKSQDAKRALNDTFRQFKTGVTK